MSHTPVKTALVGIGWWSTPIGTAVKNSSRLEIAACFTRNPGKRAAFAKSHGCAEAGSFEEILKDKSIEGILITTPNSAHAGQIQAALRAGKHVWVEKPLTNTLAEAGPVLEAWRASGKVLAVGHCYRRAAGHRVMRRMMDEGAVGRPLWAEAAFTNPAGLTMGPDRWRFFRAECPGGPLMQMGVHHCDTLNYLMGRPVRVTGVHKRLATPAEIDDVTMTIVEHEGGGLSSIACSFVTSGAYSVRVHGTEGILALEMHRENTTLAERTNQETVLTLQPKGKAGFVPVVLPQMTEMIQDELEEFADCVRTGKAPETGPEEGLYALALVEGSCLSAGTGRPVEIRDLLKGLAA
ncbi:MAG: Gfo/Idh/MocA family oxidoreductase [Candidatus Tectomicrobia bacterium]|uniref:Gfo/Idh/MocA family oxidoreductase n=1 Tax=Tectimicrobiota bacterium TaxID=2528274 RepID=A0A932I1P3_UNCTE|nr:Gfo/Idh/MocA family oxidoreductase [Candidatus Tectomicrobia bacterium]